MWDRNLGVILAMDEDWIGGTATGFYYKYGHRAPYFEDKLKNNGKKYHGGLNDYSSWNEKDANNNDIKAKTDPCPPGYKVPSAAVWYSEKQENMDFGASYFTYYPISIIGGVNFAIYYPYSGYVYRDENSQYVQSPSEISSSNTTYINLPRALTKTGDIGKKNSYKFVDIVVKEDIMTKSGQVLTRTSESSMYYDRSEINRQSTGVRYYLGTYKIYKTEWDQKTLHTMTTEKFKKDFWLQYQMLEAYQDILDSFENVFYSTNSYTNNKSINLDHGYQVRCVKE
jgi:hypothetical protein